VRLDDGRLEEVLLLHHGRRSWVRAYDHLHIFFFFFPISNMYRGPSFLKLAVAPPWM
jgi:hypothetical protein